MALPLERGCLYYDYLLYLPFCAAAIIALLLIARYLLGGAGGEPLEVLWGTLPLLALLAAALLFAALRCSRWR